MSKKILGIILVSVLMASQVFVSAEVGEPQFVYDSFNEGVVGSAEIANWEVTNIKNYSVAYASSPDEYDKSLQIRKNSDGYSASTNQRVTMRRNLVPSYTGNFIFECKVRGELFGHTSSFYSLPLVNSAGNAEALRLLIGYMDSGVPTIAIAHGKPTMDNTFVNTVIVSSLIGSKFYRILFDINLTGSKFSVFLENDNGELDMVLEDVNFKNPMTDIGRISFNSNSSNGLEKTKVLINDIKMYKKDAVSSAKITAESLDLGILNAITTDFVLPTSGDNNSAIAWTSNNSAITIEANKAVINRPWFGEADQQVALTATVTNGEALFTKTFDVTLPAYTKTINFFGPTYKVGEDTVTVIPSSGILEITSSATNQLSISVPVTIVAALYTSDNRLLSVSVDSAEEEIQSGQMVPFVNMLDCSEAEDGCFIKLFYFNTLIDMTPHQEFIRFP